MQKPTGERKRPTHKPNNTPSFPLYADENVIIGLPKAFSAEYKWKY